VVVSVGSFLYWLLAARIVDKDAVGNASAMFTACFLLSLLASPGLVITVSRFGSEPRRTPTAVYAWSLLVSLAGAVIVAALFTVSAPRRVDDALAGLPPAATLAILAAMVGGQAVSALTDVRLIGRREWEWLFARHAAITVIRLAGLAFVGSDPNGRRLFLLAIGAFALTGLPFVPASLRTSDGWPRLGDIRGHTASVVNYSLTNAVGQLAIQGTALLAPLTVLGWVSSDEFAELYIGWGIMSVVFAGIQLVTQILLVEGSRAGAGRPHQIRTALQVTVGGAVVASVASIPFQALVPRLYGDDFAATAELILPLMTGTVPWAVTGVALTAARIRADHRQSVMISAVFAVAVIGLVMIGTMLGGTMGASVGWLAGSTVAAGYAWRDLRAHEPRAGADAAAGPVPAEALAGGPDG
jgi:O-antigen/teichoic acid export membrane protein